MAIVQQNHGSGAVGAGLVATVTLPSPTTAGNKVLIVGVLHSVGTIVSSGFAKDVPMVWGPAPSNQAIIFTKNTSGGESSWSLTGFAFATEVVMWYVFELPGLVAGAVDKTATAAGGSSTATQATGTTAATTVANELAVAVVVGLLASGTVTFSGWTNGYVQQITNSVALDSGVTASVGVAFGELVATGATSTTVSMSPSAFGFGGVATYPESAVVAATAAFMSFFD